MARTLELDTITEPGNTGTANITLSTDTTTTMPKVDINSGAIDGTTLGASVPSTVAATTLTTSGAATFGNSADDATTVTGTLAVTRAATLSDNVSLGTSSLDVITVAGTTTINAVSGCNTIVGATSGDQTIDIASHDEVDGGLKLAGTLVKASAAEINKLDGVTATTAEINLLDGGTSATGTTLADADRLLVNDGGTMKQVALTDFETYFEASLDTQPDLTTVGALNAGSITSGFGSIDTGSSTITTTGALAAATLDTGQGANELYDMNQNVKTDSDVTFASLTAIGNTTIGTCATDCSTHQFEVNGPSASSAKTGSNVDVSNLLQLIRSTWESTGNAVGLGFTVSTVANSVGGAIIFERKGSQGYGDMHFATKPSGSGSGADIPIRMTIASGGAVTAAGGFSTSDERLKENITTITGGLETINGLTGKKFNWKPEAQMDTILAQPAVYWEEGDELPENVSVGDLRYAEVPAKTVTHYGLKAQELEAIAPDLVYNESGIRSFDVNGNLKTSGQFMETDEYAKSISMEGLIPVLIEAVKELSAKVTALEAA